MNRNRWAFMQLRNLQHLNSQQIMFSVQGLILSKQTIQFLAI